MLKSALLVSSFLVAVASATTASAQTADSADQVDAIIVTGSRGQPRTVTTSLSPIDVVDGTQLQALSGSGSLRDSLSQLLPSFQAQQWVGSSSWNSVIRPAGLRGLGGAHVLVLVNGKRRHNSAMLDLSTGNLNNGANPADLDLIPDAAIDHIEVLRDGASAQYGSDAVAGVINVILKRKDSGGSLSLSAGQRFDSDGATYRIDGAKSFGFENGGSTTISVSLKGSDRATRAAAVPGAFYPLVNGAADPRETTVDRYTYKGGLPQSRTFLLSADTEVPYGDLTVYNTTTLALRSAKVGQAGRKPNTVSDIIALYPDGFSPYYTLDERDFQILQGVKGQYRGWDWDLSTTFGEDYGLSGSENSLNASMGTASPKSFRTFSSTFDQWTTNLDVTRGVHLGGVPVQVSAGLENRYERYRTRAKDLEAYIDGGYIYSGGALNGQHAQVGAQGAIIVTPADEAKLDRDNLAAYLDLEAELSDRWTVGLAGRAEHYDDSAGDAFGGKLSSRFEITPSLAIRGTISNGFRAPSLPQQGFAQTSSQYALVTGGYRYIESKTVKVNSAVGRALGAEPLKPEKSTNYSVGLTYTPISNLNITLDAYQLDLDDRIALTGYLQGAGVAAVLTANGLPSNQYVRYFANAVDTRTRGIDLVATYALDLDQYGRLKLSAGYNQNINSIRHIKTNPTQLSGLGLTLFDRASQGGLTVANPKDKYLLGANWSLHSWTVDLRGTRYGSVDYLNNARTSDQHYGAKVLTDLSVSKSFKNVTATIGADNIFDVLPDLNTVANTSGLSPYATISPFGYYGGYYYARMTYSF